MLDSKERQFMETTTREVFANLFAAHDTLAIGTEHDGQPFVTRVFFAEDWGADDTLHLYGTFITTSRKLANLRENPRVGLFVGPSQPSIWMEGTGEAEVIADAQEQQRAIELVSAKSAVAAGFIQQVPIAPVRLTPRWLRVTDFTAGYAMHENVFDEKGMPE
jgi:nitroimidazol reductase NimA-like FMN-containing flavoprotein (pyridoxamine 5'-phosphate oxidase superfamily)